MNINEKLATIQTKFKSKKSRFNSFGKYKTLSIRVRSFSYN